MLPIFAAFLIHLLDRIRLHVSIMSLDEQNIMYLPGVGPKRKEILAKELQINTWGDLLEYYPYKYVDRSKVYTINELNGNMPFV